MNFGLTACHTSASLQVGLFMPFQPFVSPKRRKARKALRPFLIQVPLLRKGEKGRKAQLGKDTGSGQPGGFSGRARRVRVAGQLFSRPEPAGTRGMTGRCYELIINMSKRVFEIITGEKNSSSTAKNTTDCVHRLHMPRVSTPSRDCFPSTWHRLAPAQERSRQPKLCGMVVRAGARTCRIVVGPRSTETGMRAGAWHTNSALERYCWELIMQLGLRASDR
jgi:hypothetical protein